MSRINAPLIIAFGLTLAGVVSAANAVPIATTASAATSVSTGTIIAYPSISTTGANPNGTALTLANRAICRDKHLRIRNSSDGGRLWCRHIESDTWFLVCLRNRRQESSYPDDLCFSFKRSDKSGNQLKFLAECSDLGRI